MVFGCGASQISLQRRIVSSWNGFTSQSGKSISDAAAAVQRRAHPQNISLSESGQVNNRPLGAKSNDKRGHMWPSGRGACSKAFAIYRISCCNGQGRVPSISSNSSETGGGSELCLSK